MKKIFLLLGIISYQTSYCQDMAKTTVSFTNINATNDKENDEISPNTILIKRNGQFIKTYLNNMPSAVMADFVKKFGDVDGVTWKIDDNDVNGYFSNNGQKIVVNYKKNGHLVSTRKTYAGNILPKNIRQYVQSELNKGYSINLVTEVVGELVTLYEVNLVNQNNISIVRLSRNKDAEPEVTERIFYTKVPAGAL